MLIRKPYSASISIGGTETTLPEMLARYRDLETAVVAIPDGKVPAYLSAKGPVGFDDLNGGYTTSDNFYGANIPDGYHNITWSGLVSLDSRIAEGFLGGSSGYDIGTISPHNVGFTHSDATLFTMTADSGTFTLKSVYMTSAFQSSQMVEVTAYHAQVEAYHEFVTITDAQATLEQFDFKNVDQVSFAVVDPGSGGNQVVYDNFQFMSGNITGTIFNDGNGDGKRSGAEKGIAGVTVYIDANDNGHLDKGEYSTVTDAHGNYSFKDVTPGVYDIRQVAPTGYFQTSPGPEYDVSYSVKATVAGFVDISGTGSVVTPMDSDEGYTAVDLSAPIRFYGVDYGTMYISANGFISFQAPQGNTYANIPLPGTINGDGGPVTTLIAALWTDLYNNDGTGNIYFQNDSANHRIIVEWSNLQPYQTTEHDTFEAIIGYNGKVTFEYGQLDDSGAAATIGVQNQAGTSATQISYDQAIASNSGYNLTPITHVSGGPVVVTVASGKTSKAGPIGDQQLSAAPAHGQFGQAAFSAGHHGDWFATAPLHGHDLLIAHTASIA